MGCSNRKRYRFRRSCGRLYGERIDLNEQLIRNKPATFFMRVSGDAMIGAGIFNGDIVIVDRSVKPVSGKIVIAILNGEMLIRRLKKPLTNFA
jgi:DNA polymerase V